MQQPQLLAAMLKAVPERMKKITVLSLITFCLLNAKAQTFSLENLWTALNSDFDAAYTIMTSKGWTFYFTKNNTQFKTHIWYYNGLLRQNPNNQTQKEVVAQYWLKKVYSNTTTYQAIDYETDEKTYQVLISEAKTKGLKFVSAENERGKYFNTYTDNKYTYDFVEYQESHNRYGIIVSKK